MVILAARSAERSDLAGLHKGAAILHDLAGLHKGAAILHDLAGLHKGAAKIQFCSKRVLQSTNKRKQLMAKRISIA